MQTDLQDVFRQSMRRLAATVSVITCTQGVSRFGVTATAVTSLCAEPASVLVCLNARASITQPLLQDGRFCVNILQSHQAEISTMFGGKAKGEDRFNYGTWLGNDEGVPFLVDAQANLFCRVDGAMPYGTHKIIVGLIEGGGFAPQISPLLFQNGAYTAIDRTAA
jgi:flavin reductase